MLNKNDNIPFWVWGALVALVLIVVSARGVPGVDNPALRQRFVTRPADPNAPTAVPVVDFSQLSAEAQALVQAARERLRQGGSALALTPVAIGQRLRVEVAGVQPSGGGVRVTGTVTNISAAPLDVPVRAFQLRDSTGAVYASNAAGVVTLAPGASTPLDLTVPLPAGRGLHLVVVLPPDPPLDQVLLLGN
jgi:hypothetical protein